MSCFRIHYGLMKDALEDISDGLEALNNDVVYSLLNVKGILYSGEMSGKSVDRLKLVVSELLGKISLLYDTCSGVQTNVSKFVEDIQKPYKEENINSSIAVGDLTKIYMESIENQYDVIDEWVDYAQGYGFLNAFGLVDEDKKSDLEYNYIVLENVISTYNSNKKTWGKKAETLKDNIIKKYDQGQEIDARTVSLINHSSPRGIYNNTIYKGREIGGNQNILFDGLEKEEIKKMLDDYKIKEEDFSIEYGVWQEENDGTFEDFVVETMQDHGCGYVAMANTLFDAYVGKEIEFEKKFGIPYYDKTGKINYDELTLALYAETYYTSAKRGIVGERNIKGGNNLPRASEPIIWKRTLESFGEKHGVDINVNKEIVITKEEVKEALDEGKKVITSSLNTGIYSKNGNIETYSGSHAMTAIGVTEEGIIVSNWGDIDYIYPDEEDFTDPDKNFHWHGAGVIIEINN